MFFCFDALCLFSFGKNFGWIFGVNFSWHLDPARFCSQFLVETPERRWRGPTNMRQCDCENIFYKVFKSSIMDKQTCDFLSIGNIIIVITTISIRYNWTLKKPRQYGCYQHGWEILIVTETYWRNQGGLDGGVTPGNPPFLPCEDRWGGPC